MTEHEPAILVGRPCAGFQELDKKALKGSNLPDHTVFPGDWQLRDNNESCRMRR